MIYIKMMLKGRYFDRYKVVWAPLSVIALFMSVLLENPSEYSVYDNLRNRDGNAISLYDKSIPQFYTLGFSAKNNNFTAFKTDFLNPGHEKEFHFPLVNSIKYTSPRIKSVKTSGKLGDKAQLTASNRAAELQKQNLLLNYLEPIYPEYLQFDVSPELYDRLAL